MSHPWLGVAITIDPQKLTSIKCTTYGEHQPLASRALRPQHFSPQENRYANSARTLPGGSGVSVALPKPLPVQFECRNQPGREGVVQRKYSSASTNECMVPRC